MAINIKDAETDDLVRQLAKKTGESITKAVRVSLEERLRRLSGSQRAPAMREKLEQILARVDALPVVDARSPDEIIGYDENGLPQ